MSWKENLAQQYTITTGDGKQYTGEWKLAQVKTEFNNTEFTFLNVPGSLVKKGERKGNRYTFEIYFQGDNHLSTAESFRTSANDKRPWRVQHPYYGPLTVQCPALDYDNNTLNITRISGVLIETLSNDYPSTAVAPQQQAINLSTVAVESLTTAYANDVQPVPADIPLMLQNNSNAFNEGNRFALGERANNYRNAFNKANSEVLGAIAQPANAIASVQNLLRLPQDFQTSVSQRLNIFQKQITDLTRTVIGQVPTRNQKELYQNNVGTLITGMAYSAVTPQAGDYQNAPDVLEVVSTIETTFNNYLTQLNELQSAFGGTPTAFIPNATALNALAEAVSTTLSNLYAIALNSKRQRTFVLEEDSNWALLAHRLYGLGIDNSTILQLMNENKAGLSSILQVPKNTPITYYV